MISLRIALLISLLTLGFAAPVIAEDLSDPAVCFDCHDDTDRSPTDHATRPQVHKLTGGFFVEDHSDFSCIDCHTFITDLEHEETAPGNEVDCTECHDEAPTKE